MSRGDRRRTDPAELDSSSVIDPADVERILIPVFDENRLYRGLDIVLALAEGYEADVLFVYPVVVPSQLPLSTEYADDVVDSQRRSFERLLETATASNVSVDVDGLLRIGRRQVHIVSTATAQRDVDLLVQIPSEADSPASRFRLSRSERLARSVDCDVVEIHRPEMFGGFASVLVPIRRNLPFERSLATADALYRAQGTWIELLCVIPTNASKTEYLQAKETLNVTLERLVAFDRASTWVLEADSVEDAVVEQSEYYDAIVVEKNFQNRFYRMFLDSPASKVARNAKAPVFTVWGN